MTKKLNLKNIALTENGQANSLKISIKNNEVFKDTVKLFRDMIKQDKNLSSMLAVQTKRSDIETFVIKNKGELPSGYSNLKEVVEQLLVPSLTDSLQNDAHFDKPQKTSAKTSATTSDDPTPSDEEENDMPSKFEKDPAPIDFDPYDFGDEDTELLGISGEDFYVSASQLNVYTANHAYDDEDELRYCMDY